MTPRTCLCLSEADRFESEGFTLTAEHLRRQHAADKAHITGGTFARKGQIDEQETGPFGTMEDAGACVNTPGVTDSAQGGTDG